MEWVKNKTEISKDARVPLKSWCPNPEAEALAQAANLAAHPAVVSHVALMPDCHVGYGMPIGGVIACKDAVIPNAVGVDIGCGMGAVRTTATIDQFPELSRIRKILDAIKYRVPVGEGNSHRHPEKWDGFEKFEDTIGRGGRPGWIDDSGLHRDRLNLGTLGGGNHFIELQADTEGVIWLMLHSGSRNLGYRIANWYQRIAKSLNEKWRTAIPSPDLAFLPLDASEGEAYIRDMAFAMAYARENRRRMMEVFREVMSQHVPGIKFTEEINIHHNYAAIENHFGHNVWVHRKGATSAREGELGIIPGSMGTASYIVRGLGNPDSFTSCSHGAGRRMGRKEADRRLTMEECDRAMQGIVFDRWHKVGAHGRRAGKGGVIDLSEAPQAYKDIDTVIANQRDLVETIVKLRPLGVIKG